MLFTDAYGNKFLTPDGKPPVTDTIRVVTDKGKVGTLTGGIVTEDK